MGHSCDQIDGVEVLGVKIHLGRRYLDIHLHWGEGGLREPMAGGERGTRGSGLKNSHLVSRIL